MYVAIVPNQSSRLPFAVQSRRRGNRMPAQVIETPARYRAPASRTQNAWRSWASPPHRHAAIVGHCGSVGKAPEVAVPARPDKIKERALDLPGIELACRDRVRSGQTRKGG
jgi:hypothetical protein